jgi:hypothetical protein
MSDLPKAHGEAHGPQRFAEARKGSYGQRRGRLLNLQHPAQAFPSRKMAFGVYAGNVQWSDTS